MKKLFLLFLLLGFLTACSSSSDKAKEEAEFKDTPVEELYNKAQDLLVAEKYKAAADAFDEVERQHPYSQWAAKAQLMSAYSYYQAERYQEAALALDRFIQLHPGDEKIGYAYYLKAMVSYDQINDIERDQSITQEALESLREVIRRFPNTDYAKDAKLKIDLTLDHLAAKEMQIGRFYQKRQLYTAAINRFRNVVDQYQTTAHVPEALHRLVECYYTLGIRDQAEANAAVLGHNYPGSEWYQYSYSLLKNGKIELPKPTGDEKSFIGKTIGSIFN
ncbi:MAG: outer membrane protein assembly factor BamD [Alphaproteobacteria bacterium]|nr:MAG: outer membrane protein assembly factor BamD [Alphaproteobacteria bacterium]